MQYNMKKYVNNIFRSSLTRDKDLKFNQNLF